MNLKPRYFIVFFIMPALLAFGQADQQRLERLLHTADSTYLAGANANKVLRLYLEIDSLLSKKKYRNSSIFHVKERIIRNYNSLNDTKKAIWHAKGLLARSREVDDCYYQADALINLMVSYVLQRQFDIGMMYYERAKEILDNEEFPQLDLYAKISLSFAHIVNEDTENAIIGYEGALQMAMKLKEYRLLNRIYGNLAHSYMIKKEYKKAIEVCEKSIILSQKNNFDLSYVVISNLGQSYAHLQQYDSAMHYFEKAYEMALESKDKLYLATANFDIGSLYSDQKQYASAIDYYLKSYHFTTLEINYPATARACKKLSEAYQEMHDYKKALVYLKEYHAINDTLNHRSINKKLEEFQIKYETKQKEEKIVILDRENKLKATVIKQEKDRKKMRLIIFSVITMMLIISMLIWKQTSNKRLLIKQQNLRFKSIIEAEQGERIRIAKDLHDSLGQSLSVVKLQATLLQPVLEEQTKHETLLKQIDNTYDELRNISHNIMPDTLIRLGLVPAVRELVEGIPASSSLKINFTVNQEFNTLNEDASINLYRIIQETLSNCLKHAKATIINIVLESKDGITSLYIKDNGKGMDPFKINSSIGMGWKNVISRVNILSGKIKVTSTSNQGTTIAIHFKSR